MLRTYLVGRRRGTDFPKGDSSPLESPNQGHGTPLDPCNGEWPIPETKGLCT